MFQKCALPSGAVARTALSRGARASLLQGDPGRSSGSFAIVCSLVAWRTHTAPVASAVTSSLERLLESKAVTAALCFSSRCARTSIRPSVVLAFARGSRKNTSTEPSDPPATSDSSPGKNPSVVNSTPASKSRRISASTGLSKFRVS
jgi:hypothetical protein